MGVVAPQEFEEFHEMKFGKKPRLAKKLPPDARSKAKARPPRGGPVDVSEPAPGRLPSTASRGRGSSEDDGLEATLLPV